MIWETGNPPREELYLCAFPKGDGYVYAVQLWKDGAWWYGKNYLEPYAWASIDSPKMQEDMLDELHEQDKSKK